MSRFLNGGNRYLGPPQFVGRGKPIRSPVEQSLDPALHEGAVVYATDGQLYYSDKTAWLIPTATVQIGRPAALAPTDSQEQTQLRLTPFYSPQGLTQTGVYVEVANSPDGFDTPLFTRQIATTSGNGYQIVYPGDGLSPGRAVWWRGLYTGTEGSQSDFSLPYRQVYPELIDTPVPVTNDGATSGAVTISQFTSRFGLSHVETEVHFWQIGDDPEVDTPISTATGIGGASVSLPEDLVDGANYLWRARYGGQAGAGAPVVHSGWTETRTVNNGAASMSLVFDVDLAVNRTISLGLGALSGSVNITVDWGDGTSDAYTSGGVRSHGYGAGVSGQVTVVISGQMAQFGGNHDITGLVRMDAIGYQLGLTSLEQAFRNVTPNTTHVNPALPPQVTSLRGAFRDGNPGFDVGSLDTSAITDMSEMFLDALRFNGDLSGLDTSSVTTMERMFCMDARLDSTAFNQPVGMWDVSKVRNFRRMFAIEGWQGVCVFNQDLGAWDTSAATDMSFMFAGENAAYEHRFDNGGSDGIRSWNVAHVTTFEGMFQLAAPDPTESVLHDFNQPLDGWETAAATSVKAMFKGSRFTRALDSWDVSNVQDFSAMFSLSLFNASLAGWDFSSATTVESMVYRTPFNADTTGWRLPADAGRLMHQAGAFNHASALTWDTAGVTSMEALFWGANDFNQDITGWDVSAVTTMKDMFRGFTSFNRDISVWDVSNVSIFDGMFYDARGFGFSLGGWPLSKTSVSMSLIWDTTPIHGDAYSRTLIGWANTAYSQDGPFSVPLTANDGPPTYTATVHASGGRFEDAVSARAFLARSRRVLVASAGTADADGDFLWNGATQQFEKANGWRLVDTGTAWELHDATGTVRATAQDATMPDRPYRVATWDGVLSAASVDLDGMGWTIIDGGLV